VSFSPDGQRIVSINRYTNKTASIWDASTGRELTVLKGHTDRLKYAAFSPDGKHVVTLSDDLTGKLWNVADASESATLSGQTSYLWCSTFSHDSKRIAAAGKDGTIRIWDTKSGASLAVLKEHWDYVRCLSFSQDEQFLVSAGDDGNALLWHRRRPEYWWGIAWLPEFWLTVVLTGALGWSLSRDRRTR
jgi:WD40 repeat protein